MIKTILCQIHDWINIFVTQQLSFIGAYVNAKHLLHTPSWIESLGFTKKRKKPTWVIHLHVLKFYLALVNREHMTKENLHASSHTSLNLSVINHTYILITDQHSASVPMFLKLKKIRIRIKFNCLHCDKWCIWNYMFILTWSIVSISLKLSIHETSY